MAVVAAHERVAVRPPVCERRRGERVQPGRDRTAEQLLRPLRQRPRLVGRVDAAAGEAELARDAQHRRLVDRVRQLGGRRQRGVGLDREDDEVDASDRVGVGRAGGSAGLRRLRLRALGVTGADHDVVARVDEAPREREPEVSGAADDRDPHRSLCGR